MSCQRFGKRFPVFVHIEKAGGMTLHHILNANDVGYVSLSPKAIHGSEWGEAQHQMLRRLFPLLSGMGGHRVRPWIDYSRRKTDPFYLTFLREPYERYLSHYRYQVAIMNVDWTLDQFVENPYFWNFQVKKIAGSEDLERAKQILRSQFSFVGILERFNESLLYMERAFGSELDLRYVVENRNTKRPAEHEKVDPHIKSRIMEANELDTQLYAYVEKELFQEYRNTWGSDIDLPKFEESLTSHRWRLSARMSWKVKSLLVRRCLQPISSNLVGVEKMEVPWCSPVKGDKRSHEDY